MAGSSPTHAAEKSYQLITALLLLKAGAGLGGGCSSPLAAGPGMAARGQSAATVQWDFALWWFSRVGKFELLLWLESCVPRAIHGFTCPPSVPQGRPLLDYTVRQYMSSICGFWEGYAQRMFSICLLVFQGGLRTEHAGPVAMRIWES